MKRSGIIKAREIKATEKVLRAQNRNRRKEKEATKRCRTTRSGGWRNCGTEDCGETKRRLRQSAARWKLSASQSGHDRCFRAHTQTGASEHSAEHAFRNHDATGRRCCRAQAQSVVQYDIGRPIHPSKSHMKNINIDVGSRFQPRFIGLASMMHI